MTCAKGRKWRDILRISLKPLAHKGLNEGLERQKVTQMRFGEILIQRREERHISRYRLAKLSGIAYATIRSYEQGNVMPPVDKADTLLKALGVEMIIGKKVK